jgi:hypothetical protein
MMCRLKRANGGLCRCGGNLRDYGNAFKKYRLVMRSVQIDLNRESRRGRKYLNCKLPLAMFALTADLDFAVGKSWENRWVAIDRFVVKQDISVEFFFTKFQLIKRINNNNMNITEMCVYGVIGLVHNLPLCGSGYK